MIDYTMNDNLTSCNDCVCVCVKVIVQVVIVVEVKRRGHAS